MGPIPIQRSVLVTTGITLPGPETGLFANRQIIQLNALVALKVRDGAASDAQIEQYGFRDLVNLTTAAINIQGVAQDSFQSGIGKIARGDYSQMRPSMEALLQHKIEEWKDRKEISLKLSCAILSKTIAVIPSSDVNVKGFTVQLKDAERDLKNLSSNTIATIKEWRPKIETTILGAKFSRDIQNVRSNITLTPEEARGQLQAIRDEAGKAFKATIQNGLKTRLNWAQEMLQDATKMNDVDGKSAIAEKIRVIRLEMDDSRIKDTVNQKVIDLF